MRPHFCWLSFWCLLHFLSGPEYEINVPLILAWVHRFPVKGTCGVLSCVPSTSFVPLQKHTLIKPPRMNLFYYWTLSAGEYPKCPLALHALAAAQSGVLGPGGRKQRVGNTDRKIGAEYVALFPSRPRSLPHRLTQDGFPCCRACACQ